MSSVGMKNDYHKPQMHLIDRTAMQSMAIVLQHGAAKYGKDNWKGGIEFSRLVSAALRHLFAISDGEDIDHESGELHASHVMCNMMFLIWMMQNRPDLDDRFRFIPKPTFSEVKSALEEQAEAEAQKMEDEIKELAKKFAPIIKEENNNL
jgi:hypothetical protein